jgi:hypothetical protein
VIPTKTIPTKKELRSKSIRQVRSLVLESLPRTEIKKCSRYHPYLCAVVCWFFLLCGFLVSHQSLRAQAAVAPKPLYRDPVHDGAADPSVVWNRAEKKWMMFYTSRRADLTMADPNDVAWVHGTSIGIAESTDGGTTWKYAGTAEIPYGKKDYSYWAPDVLFARGAYHMFVTVVPGIFHNWNAGREIIHLSSRDLHHWKFNERLPLASSRSIDPYVMNLDNGSWRLWYKDEQDHSYIHSVDSPDLDHWSADRIAIHDRSSEGPIVFCWKGSIWLIVDSWDGLSVYRSNDAAHWIYQKEHLLAGAGRLPTDRSNGHHADVVVHGDHAFLFYFVQQEGADSIPGQEQSAHRSVLQVAELIEHDHTLSLDRNAPVYVDLGNPGN